jgi:hypothetical protein
MPACLPEEEGSSMSSLENLKKQAKALVRLHAERSYHLSSVAREVLPKFAAMTDREVLAGPFKLADAQEILARQHACGSWRELKAKVEAGAIAEPRPSAAGADIAVAIPVLYVSNVAASLAWYGRLGFSPLMVSGNPPYYAEVGRSGVILALRFVHGRAFAEAMDREAMFVQAIFRVANAKALYLEFIGAGAEVDVPLRREPWGSLDFVIKDPDGNRLAFGEAAKGPAG